MCNNRKEYFRQYYLENKKKYIKEKEERPDFIPKKRGRPKKIITPYYVKTGSFTISFN